MFFLFKPQCTQILCCIYLHSSYYFGQWVEMYALFSETSPKVENRAPYVLNNKGIFFTQQHNYCVPFTTLYKHHSSNGPLTLIQCGQKTFRKIEPVGSAVTMAAIVWCLIHIVRGEAIHIFTLRGMHCPNTNVSPSSFPAHRGGMGTFC